MPNDNLKGIMNPYSARLICVRFSFQHKHAFDGTVFVDGTRRLVARGLYKVVALWVVSGAKIGALMGGKKPVGVCVSVCVCVMTHFCLSCSNMCTACGRLFSVKNDEMIRQADKTCGSPTH